MWTVLKAELTYLRPYLLGGLGIAAGVVTLVSVIFHFVAEEGPPHFVATGLRGMFLIMAPMIVGFIAQSYRSEERRLRLLLAGPLTPRQIACVIVLLPLILSGIGVLAAALLIAAEVLITGRFALESLALAGYVGGLMFMGLMVSLLVQEAAAAHHQRRGRAAAVGWGGFVLAMLTLVGITTAAVLFQGPLSWPSMHLGNLVVATAAAVATLVLYQGRTDFTR